MYQAIGNPKEKLPFDNMGSQFHTTNPLTNFPEI